MTQQLTLFDMPARTPPPVPEPIPTPDLDQIRFAFLGRVVCYSEITTYANYWHESEDEYGTFDACMASGKSYMVGNSQTMAQFRQSHGSRLTRWQHLAYIWARRNPTRKLVLIAKGKEWHVYERGEFVEFGLPHHGWGGENHYISVDGKTKYHVNQD